MSTSDHLNRLRCYQDILASFSRVVSEAHDIDKLLQLACAQSARAIHLRHTKVLRYRPEKGDLLMVAGVGWKDGLVGKATFGTHPASPPGLVIHTRRPSVVADIRISSQFKASAVLKEHGIVALLNAPIIADNSVWGVLEIDSERPRAFDDDDMAFIGTLANILGAAIERDLITQEAWQTQHSLSRLRTLMREMQHRMKNNFMVVNAALMIERQRTTSDEARASLDKIMGRVVAISTAHDQLTLRDADTLVELSAYLSALVSNMAHQHEGVRIETDLEEIELAVDHAMPLGLIANELMINAIKHAFSERAGTIRVTLRADRNGGEGWLTVEDDGIGMGPPRPGSWGTELVQALAQQIGGHASNESGGVGTTVRVRFALAG